MTEDAARIVIVIGGIVGLLFWLVALSLYRRMAGAETHRQFDVQLPGRSPAEAIRDLIADGRLFSPQATVERPDAHRLNIRQAGIDVQFEATRAGDGALLRADVDDSGLTRKFQLGLGAFVLILMPLVIGVTCVLLWHFVAPSPKLAVRGQSIQVAQIVHVLWPPFLIYSIWKRLRNQATNAVSNLLVFAQAAVASGNRTS